MNEVPKISVCLPNLNTKPYLMERFQSIFDQTFQDWELIVCDSFSDDGSWELIQELAAKEPRMRIYQTPRRGIYIGFNDCIERARGEYIYIATSDDTMMPTCLEKMAAALDENPDCGIAQCELVTIDSEGKPNPDNEQWRQYTLGLYNSDLVLKKNKRIAPHDGLLFPVLFTIYTSVTQLLIRRKVFERVGLYEQRWGAAGDYEWNMRAALLENCVYIPEKLATWRIHATQATQATATRDMRLKMAAMARAAYERAKGIAGAKLEGIEIEDFVYFLERDAIELGSETLLSPWKKLKFICGQLPAHPRLVFDYAWSRLAGQRWGQWKNAVRYERLNRLLAANNVPAPVFK